MKFKAGDLVTYKDFKTQAGHFKGCTALLVLGTDGHPHLGTHLHLHHLKTGNKGWDWAAGYVKIPST